MSVGWRKARVLALVMAVGGCGFHPLYAPNGTTAAGLKDIFVDVIPNRNGQLLREALERRLEGSGSDGSKQYILSVGLNFAGTSIGIQGDNSSDRTRFLGTAAFTLKEPGFLGKKIVSGTVPALDGVNVIDEQFFYSDLSTDAVERRMAENLADRIVQALAIYFRAHPDQA